MANIRKARATACLFLTAVIWGVAFVAQLVGMDYVGSFTYGGVRFALGALSLIPIIFIFERGAGDKARQRQTVLMGMGAGVILFAASSLQQFGIAITGSAGKAGFITGLYIVLVPIFGVFLGRKAGVLTWMGAVCACIGLYFLSVTDGLGSVGTGDAVLFIGAFFWAAHILWIDRFVPGVNPLRFSMVQFAVCSVLSMLCAFIFEDVRLANIIAGRMPILYGGILSVGVAYTLQIVGQRHVEPSKAAIIFSTESLFSAVGAALILGEIMSGRGYLGCALIFCGIILSQIVVRRR
ncbi:transporter [Clostridia bacterium]|nr:transporter [Clostridia bacterium]